MLYCNFDKYEVNDSVRNCISLVYPSGYQIWDITCLDKVFEIFSMRDVPCVKAVKLIPTPEIKEEKGTPFFESRPLVVAVKDDKNSPDSSILTFTSLKSGESSMVFKHKISNVHCNRHAICVVKFLCTFSFLFICFKSINLYIFINNNSLRKIQSIL